MKDLTVISAAEFVAAARALVGTPFRHQGRCAYGVDCTGFLILAARNAGLVPELLGLKDVTTYGPRPGVEVLETVQRTGKQIRRPVMGCIILMQLRGMKYPHHFGICAGDGNMIHADAMRGVVVEHGYRGPWVRWTHSLWLAPGVDYQSCAA